MDRKTLVSGIFVGLLIGLAVGYFVSRTEVLRLQNKIDTLEMKLADKEDQIGSLILLAANLRQQLKTEVLGVYFSPKGGCEDQVLYWINRANKSIHVLIYIFTLDSAGDALIKAHRRGIDVKVIFERGKINEDNQYQRLKRIGINVHNDTISGEMHDKIMIVDSFIVLTGSFNWSENAENENNENIVVIKSVQLAKIYEAEFEKIWKKSI